MQVATSEEILAAFDLIDREGIELPDLGKVDWQELDFLSWTDASGRRGFVVAPWNGGLRGIVLEMNSGRSTTPTGMCSLCLSVHNFGTKSAIARTHAEPRTSIGIHVCADLDCSQMVRGRYAGRSMGETISTAKKIERLQLNLQKFVGRIVGSR